MSPLGFAFGAAGGASGGFAPAFETIMRNRQVEQGLELDERSLDLRADDLAFRMDAASEERAQRNRERGTITGSGGRTFRDPEKALRWESAWAESRRAPDPEPTIRVAGREFPDTPEGQRAALIWLKTSSAAGRAPTREEGPAMTSLKSLPGETGSQRLMRLEEVYGMPASQLSREFRYATDDERESEIRNQARSVLRGR